MKIKPKVIIGLGNPGKEYQNTYHNVGQIFISWLLGHETWNIKHKTFLATKLRLHNSSSMLHDSDFMIHVAKPLTFMNESGKAIKSILAHLQAKPSPVTSMGMRYWASQILIAHDDSDIELGKYKFSFGRNSAGHKGVESIIKSLGTKDFWRLRIGIGKSQKLKVKGEKSVRAKAGEFVLKKISERDSEILEKVFQEII